MKNKVFFGVFVVFVVFFLFFVFFSSVSQAQVIVHQDADEMHRWNSSDVTANVRVVLHGNVVHEGVATAVECHAVAAHVREHPEEVKHIAHLVEEVGVDTHIVRAVTQNVVLNTQVGTDPTHAV